MLKPSNLYFILSMNLSKGRKLIRAMAMTSFRVRSVTLISKSETVRITVQPFSRKSCGKMSLHQS